MAKLSNDAILELLRSKGYEAVDISGYKNLSSEIVIKCPQGHILTTDLTSFRSEKFYCPRCEGIEVGSTFVNPRIPPAKNGYRIVAFDQATEKMGISIWDNGQLVYYDLMIFTGETLNRLVKIKYFLEHTVKEWAPDLLVFEDIQQQHGNVAAYKVLAGLLTLCMVFARENGIMHQTYLPSVWRSGLGLNKAGSRTSEKILAIQTVKSWFNVNVNDDTAEAILIGKYATMQNRSKKLF